MDFTCILPEYEAVVQGLPKSLEHLFSNIQKIQSDIDDELTQVYSLFNDREPTVEGKTRLYHSLYSQILECVNLSKRKVDIANQACELVDHYLHQINDVLKQDNTVTESPPSSPKPSLIESLFPSSEPSRPALSEAVKRSYKKRFLKQTKEKQTPVEEPIFSSEQIHSSLTEQEPHSLTLNEAESAFQVPLTLEFEQDKEQEEKEQQEQQVEQEEEEKHPDLFSPSLLNEDQRHKNLSLDLSIQTESLSSNALPPLSSPLNLNAQKVDPNESLYCLCQRPPFGIMVGCDAMESCQYEWFHLECVGLKKAPKGHWFCNACLKKRTKRSIKKRRRT